MSDQLVRAACNANFDEHKGDCSGFACAVAAAVGVPLQGPADKIVDTITGGGAWSELANGPAATAAAANGKLVIAGLKGADQATPSEHGHVVVVVGGGPDQGIYPYAFWGSLGGVPGKNEPINYAWVHADLPNVVFAERNI